MRDVENDSLYTSPSCDVTTSHVGRRFSALGWGYLLLVLAIYVGALALQLAAGYLWPQAFSAWWWNWLLSLAPLYGVGLPLLWVILRRIPAAPHNRQWVNRCAATEEKPPFTFKSWMILLIIGLGCMYAGGLLGNAVMSILSAAVGYDYRSGLNSLVEESPLWMTCIGTCICAPIGEEILFRKLLVDRARGYGDRVAILLSGLLFGLFHGNLFQLFYAFLLGMLLAYVYTRSGDLRWCVAMHAAVNFLGSIVIPRLALLLPADGVSFTSPLQILVTVFLLVWQYGLIVAAAVLTGSLWCRRKLSPGSTPLPGGRMAPVFRNPGMIACLAAMLLMTALSLIPAV